MYQTVMGRLAAHWGVALNVELSSSWSHIIEPPPLLVTCFQSNLLILEVFHITTGFVRVGEWHYAVIRAICSLTYFNQYYQFLNVGDFTSGYFGSHTIRP